MAVINYQVRWYVKAVMWTLVPKWVQVCRVNGLRKAVSQMVIPGNSDS